MVLVSARKLMILVLGVGLLILGAIWFVSNGTPHAQTSGQSERNTGSIRTADPTSSSSSKSRAQPEAGPGHTDDARARLLATLSEARARRQAAPASPESGQGKHVADTRPDIEPLQIANKTGSNTDWEKRQLETLSELLAECYDLAAEEDKGLAGTIGIRFTIAGEPELGGLVDDVEFMADASSIEHPGMRQCMQESLYALELEPPPEGIKVGREVTLRLEHEETE